RDLEHLGRGRHLEIERQLDLPHQPLDVVVGYVAAILAQMRGDAVGPRRRGLARRTHGIGMPAAARVAAGGDMGDVHAELQMSLCSHGPRLAAARQPRARSTELIAGVARRAAMMLVRCLASRTSMSISISKNCWVRLVILRLVMLPMCLAITVDRLPRLPGSFATTRLT